MIFPVYQSAIRSIGHLFFARMTVVICAVAWLMLGDQTFAEVKLPHVLQSGMVIQRDLPFQIWGWAEPGESVEVVIDNLHQSTKATDDGTWLVQFEPMQADGRPHKILVTGTNRLELDDVLIGEVWLGSGQSNMEMPMDEIGNQQEIAAAVFPEIRLFLVPHATSEVSQADVDASWKHCTPETARTFSALLYYYGRHLQKELDVPIGLINSSWGGSRIERWIPSHLNNEGEMYNGMIAPLTRFSIRGILWYQGEANVRTNRGIEYYRQMESLIGNWRKAWGHELPFYYVQISPWDYSGYLPDQVPRLWESQVAALRIPKTGMVVTTDLVDPAGLQTGHPLNKPDVGKRLGNWALAKTYGHDNVPYSGPLYKSMTIEDSRLRLAFAHTADGLKTSDGRDLVEFEIAGANNHFVPAKAEIDGHTIVVSSERVPTPTQARFAWRTLTKPNLVNSADLPASAFRTQDWQGGTGE